eukprot:m.95997 g.95997  ORF g.95997 m.95997 type:complete len:384 (-) comp8959_c2_seq1:1254-2405(-)
MKCVLALIVALFISGLVRCLPGTSALDASSDVKLFRPCASLPLVLGQPTQDASSEAFIWSAVGLPTVGIMTFGTSASVEEDIGVDCAKLAAGDLEGGISVKDVKIATLQTTTFASLLQFNDTGKHFSYSDADFLVAIPLDNIIWTVSLDASGMASFDSPIVDFNFTFYPKDKGASINPFNFCTDNSTSIDFVAHNLTYKRSNKTRIALQLIFLTVDKMTVKVEKTESINDEYSPSIFSLTTIQSRDLNKASLLYHSWKPVQFGSRERSITNMTIADTTPLTAFPDNDPIRSKIISVPLAQGNDYLSSLNVTFGADGDDGLNPGIVAWSSVFGPKSPKTPPMSLALVVTIITSFGIPACVIFFGTLTVIIKKMKKDNVTIGNPN